MQITQVKVFPVREEKLKAFVSVVFDHAFMVNDIKVIQGKDGLFLSMPSRRKKNGEFKDVAHPLNNETRRMLEENVLAEYRQLVDDTTPRRPVGDGEAVAPPVTRLHAAEGPTAGGNGAAVQGNGVAVQGPAAAASPPPAARPAAVADDGVEAGEDRTLEEVQELHLRDSFWSVP